jgi:hypothetical protein
MTVFFIVLGTIRICSAQTISGQIGDVRFNVKVPPSYIRDGGSAEAMKKAIERVVSKPSPMSDHDLAVYHMVMYWLIMETQWNSPTQRGR